MIIRNPEAIDAAIAAQREGTPITLFGARFAITSIHVEHLPKRVATIQMIEVIPLRKLKPTTTERNV